MYVLTGTAETLFYKWCNMTQIPVYFAPPGTTTEPYFFHPYIQTIIMFLGEALNIFNYVYYKSNKKGNLVYEKLRIQAGKDGRQMYSVRKYAWIGIPTLCDFCASTLGFIALVLMNASILLMIGSIGPFIVAGFSVCILKTKLNWNYYCSLIIIVVGVLITAVSGFWGGQSSYHTIADQVMGISFQLISITINGLQSIIEELILQRFFLIPAQMMGTEGIWGLMYYTILLPVLCLVECGNIMQSNGLCVWNTVNQAWYFENLLSFFEEMGDNLWLMFANIMSLVTIGLFNYYAISVTKYVNAIQRAIIGNMCTILVWFVGLIITFTTGQPWASTEWQPNVIQAIGYILIVISTLTLRDIIKWPCLPRASKVIIVEDEPEIKEENT